LLQARRGAAAKGAYRRCCRSSTMSGIACVAARPSRKNVNLFLCDPLVLGKAALARVARFVHTYRTGHFHSLW